MAASCEAPTGESAEVVPVGGEVVQTGRGDGLSSALRLGLPSSEVIHGESGSFKAPAYIRGFRDLGFFSDFYRSMFGEPPRVPLTRGRGLHFCR